MAPVSPMALLRCPRLTSGSLQQRRAPGPPVCVTRADTYRLTVGWLSVHVHAGRPQVIPVAALVVGYKRHHLAIDFLVRQEDSFHPLHLGQKGKDRRNLSGALDGWGPLCSALCPELLHTACWSRQRPGAEADFALGTSRAQGTRSPDSDRKPGLRPQSLRALRDTELSSRCRHGCRMVSRAWSPTTCASRSPRLWAEPLLQTLSPGLPPSVPTGLQPMELFGALL